MIKFRIHSKEKLDSLQDNDFWKLKCVDFVEDVYARADITIHTKVSKWRDNDEWLEDDEGYEDVYRLFPMKMEGHREWVVVLTNAHHVGTVVQTISVDEGLFTL